MKKSSTKKHTLSNDPDDLPDKRLSHNPPEEHACSPAASSLDPEDREVSLEAARDVEAVLTAAKPSLAGADPHTLQLIDLAIRRAKDIQGALHIS